MGGHGRVCAQYKVKNEPIFGQVPLEEQVIISGTKIRLKLRNLASNCENDIGMTCLLFPDNVTTTTCMWLLNKLRLVFRNCDPLTQKLDLSK